MMFDAISKVNEVNLGVFPILLLTYLLEVVLDFGNILL
jgi:hypothetical protein